MPSTINAGRHPGGFCAAFFELRDLANFSVASQFIPSIPRQPIGCSLPRAITIPLYVRRKCILFYNLFAHRKFLLNIIHPFPA